MSTTDLVILVGPMNASQLGAVTWQRPTKVVVLSQGAPGFEGADGGAIGPPAFAGLWDQVGSIDALAAKHGITELGAVGLVAFSAGWAFADRALASGRVDGAVLLDACFAPAAGFSTLVKPGYAAFAAKAARSERLLVMTGGQTGRYHKGAACAWQNVAHVEGTWAPWSPPTPVAPSTARQVGALYVAEYGTNVTHNQQVSVLGRSLVNDLLAPWLAGGARSNSGVSLVALLAGLGSALFAGTVAYTLLR